MVVHLLRPAPEAGPTRADVTIDTPKIPPSVSVGAARQADPAAPVDRRGFAGQAELTEQAAEDGSAAQVDHRAVDHRAGAAPDERAAGAIAPSEGANAPHERALGESERDRVEPARAGFVVSKAVGGAVVRNRVKRRLRHLMAERIERLPAGATVVVRAQPSAALRRYQEMALDLENALDAALRSGRRQ